MFTPNSMLQQKCNVSHSFSTRPPCSPSETVCHRLPWHINVSLCSFFGRCSLYHAATTNHVSDTTQHRELFILSIHMNYNLPTTITFQVVLHRIAVWLLEIPVPLCFSNEDHKCEERVLPYRHNIDRHKNKLPPAGHFMFADETHLKLALILKP